MSSSADTSLLQRTIELNYNNKKRSSSLKWIVVNGIFLIIFAYDLCGGCAGGLSALQWVEAGGAGVALANLLQHGARLLPARRPALPLTPAQRRLLGLHDTSLDSSFREVSPEPEAKPAPPSPAADLELSPLARARAWAGAGAGGGGGGGGSPPPSPPSPQLSPYPSPPRPDRDEFIADHQALADYLRRREESAASAGEGVAWAGGGGPAAPPPYQLAALDTEGDEEGGGGAGGGAGATLWRRLQLDPRKLTQFNLNLRLWLQVTILERVVREMDALESTLHAHGLPPRALTQVGAERVRAAAAACGALPALQALQPFLQPFPDQRYVATRYRELAAGGCLSAYRWAGGGAGAGGAGGEGGRPSDAELLLHAFAAYMDAQLPNEGGEGGGFSSVHISRGGAPPRGRGLLAIHQECISKNGVFHPFYCLWKWFLRPGGALLGGGTAFLNLRLFWSELECISKNGVFHPFYCLWKWFLRPGGALLGGGTAFLNLRLFWSELVQSSPPHYVVACGEEALEVGAGRNNLLHCLLVFVASAARRHPPALRRLHLGRHGLNVLWVIGR